MAISRGRRRMLRNRVAVLIKGYWLRKEFDPMEELSGEEWNYCADLIEKIIDRLDERASRRTRTAGGAR